MGRAGDAITGRPAHGPNTTKCFIKHPPAASNKPKLRLRCLLLPQSPEQDTKLTETLIGINIGGTGIKGGMVDPDQGTVLAGPVHVPTPKPATPAAVAEAVAQLVDRLAQLPAAPDRNTPIGVAFPGIIRHGVVRSAANIDDGWLTTDIVTFLGDRLDGQWESSMTLTPQASQNPGTAPAPGLPAPFW